MKILKYAYCLLWLVSCKSSFNEVGSLKIEPFTEHYKSGSVKNSGAIVILGDAKLRKGDWKEYYENGQLKENGKYQLDTYTTCCTAGPCPVYYSYKIGDWTYFHDNGNTKAIGTYKMGKKHIDTTCEGGDRINFGYVTEKWKFYDINGKVMKPNEELIKEIEASGYMDEYALRK